MNKSGPIIGGILGIAQGVLHTIGMVPWEVILDTSILAVVGASVGFLTNLFWRWGHKRALKIKFIAKWLS